MAKKGHPKWGSLDDTLISTLGFYRAFMDQNVLDRTSRVGFGGVWTDVPEITPKWFLPFRRSKTGTGDGR